jgi:superfamily II DNA or RNA helicase
MNSRRVDVSCHGDWVKQDRIKFMTASNGLVSLGLGTEYRTGETDPVEKFYRPCLREAVDYSRAAGYFRSSVFLIVGRDIIDFAKRDGKARLVCSPSVTDEDVTGIEKGYDQKNFDMEHSLASEIDRLLADETTHYRTRVLATLIAVGTLDLRIAVRKRGGGIYHEKLGVFRDAHGNSVSFLGSANETWQAWHELGNHEAIEVFCGWEGGSDAARVARHKGYFERLWNGMVSGIDVVEFPEAARRKLVSAALEDLDDVDMDLLTEREMGQPGKGRTALPHQSSAIAAWKEAGRRGVFEHATGSGKTFTALLAVMEHTSSGMPALIVVPSRLLLEQWASEIKDEIPDVTLLLAGAGHDKWKKNGRLAAMTDPSPDLGQRVVLSTMQTAAGDDFLRGICGGAHLLIVADEVHQTGSPFNSRIYSLVSGARLGLSATPIRYGDPDGTRRMFAYFGDVIAPPITLADAIASGRLVEYEYIPHPVHLTAEEADEWKKLTLSLRWEMGGKKDGEKGSGPLSEKAKILLIRRSRIAKKAANKIALATEVLGSVWEEGQRWLIYCEDQSHLEVVIDALVARGLSPLRYHTNMDGDKDATLAHFRTFGGIMVSIRCLDEGVDIPTVDHALILASSQNPRQFIQRRGRVLRKAKWKHLAAIHDAIVVPVSLEDEPEQTSLLKSEFVRAIEFAKSALNKDAGAGLRHIAANLGFDPDETSDVGFEEEEQ